MTKTTKKKGVQDKASISFRQCVTFLSVLKEGWVEGEGGGEGRRGDGRERRRGYAADRQREKGNTAVMTANRQSVARQTSHESTEEEEKSSSGSSDTLRL